MSRLDARPGAGRDRRLGRVVDRALDALSEVDVGRPADQALRLVESRARDLGSNERHRLREMVFGLLRNRRAVQDALLRAAAAERKPIDHLEPPVQRRLQLVASVAMERQVFEGLEALDPKVVHRFRGLLRRIATGRVPTRKGSGDPRAIELNLPDWLWSRMVEGLGEEAASRVAEAQRGRAPLTVRVTQGDRTDVLEELQAQGVEAWPTDSSPVGIRLAPGVDLATTPAHKEARLEVQDEGSQLEGLAAPPRGRVLDACAGAGGKTLQLAVAGAEVVAVEPEEKKRRELRRRLERHQLRASIVGEELEAFAARTDQRFDVVLVDAPCTGTGTLRRHPDLALRLEPSDLDRHVARQRRLLASALTLLAPSGRLIYATCSVLKEENEDQAEYLLVEAPQLRPVPVFEGALADTLGRGSAVRVGPEEEGPDGFFIAAFAARPE